MWSNFSDAGPLKTFVNSSVRSMEVSVPFAPTSRRRTAPGHAEKTQELPPLSLSPPSVIVYTSSRLSDHTPMRPLVIAHISILATPSPHIHSRHRFHHSPPVTPHGFPCLRVSGPEAGEKKRHHVDTYTLKLTGTKKMVRL